MPNPSSQPFDRLEELLVAAASRRLTTEERRVLNEILRTDSAARSHAARWLIDDAILANQLREAAAIGIFGGAPEWAAVGDRQAAAKQTATRAAVRNRRPLALAIAAALAICGAVLWFNFAKNEPTVARFGALDGCQWVKADNEPKTGDGLKAGQIIEISGGRAEINFSCGAVTTLEGPCIFEVKSGKEALLVLGNCSTRAEHPDSKGFVLRTRTSTIVDLGTRFAARVAPDGHSHVEVTEGEVAVHLPGERSPHLLRLGDSLSLEPGRARVMVRIERGDESPDFRFPSIAPPSDSDYADARQGFASISLGSGTLRAQHQHNGRSGPVEKLLNGRGQSTQDQPEDSVFFEDDTRGSLLLDLGRKVGIEKINTYSWHENFMTKVNRLRAQQCYRLYGSDRDSPPSITDEPEAAGWTLIARVNTDEHFAVRNLLDRPAQQACSITSQTGSLGRYRYLLWAVEPTRVPDKETLNHTFYGEFDVYAKP
ncbi:FecR domain-containing protein [Luteolibacter yonseiensis]|uniref:FecR domain-containing protein n=1 Tax=Luteolibacter yonseiensis TaxID=1144680 RepID=A0A934V737_9BACT|nr:FecR domain-containing protein [Luteolibacter yonseiensis]MBK1815722.1 FecR domain-containing protein [Luteolibacter yonseiensis]